MKRVLRKISDVILISVLCLTLFLTAVTPIAFAVGGTVFTDCLKSVGSQAELDGDAYSELVLTYAEFYSDLGQGDFIAALVDGVVDIPLAWFSVTTEAFTDVASEFTIPVDTLVMHPAGYNDLLYFLNDLGELVVYDNRGGGGGRVRDVEVSDDARIDGNTFAEICTQLENQYSPKNTATKISWRNDKRWSEATGGNSNTYGAYGTFFTEGYFCNVTTWTEVYLVPFYTNGADMYHGMYQFHYWQERTVNEDGEAVITLYMEYWDMLNKSEPMTVVVSDELMNIRYIDVSFLPYDKVRYHKLYDNYTEFLKRSGSSDPLSFDLTSDYYLTNYFSSDCLTVLDLAGGQAPANSFKQTVSAHDESCTCGGTCDIGYYCSNVPIKMDYGDVDFSQFTAEDTVTLSGDTIYDYTITNNTTGDSTTVNNYITNNYNYPDTGDSGDSGVGGGSVSGDVNVSGNIDVGGSFDVNVNVNTNGSADGGSMPVDVDLNNYLEQTPEQAKPITEFFSIFFDFLPPDLLGLICLGVAVAIILRIWGR